MVVGGCQSLVAEHWQIKPEALGSIPGGTTFLSFPLLFQRSSDSNGPDNLYRSSDLGESHLSGSLCCDEAQILSKSSYKMFISRLGVVLELKTSGTMASRHTIVSYR